MIWREKRKEEEKEVREEVRLYKRKMSDWDAARKMSDWGASPENEWEVFAVKEHLIDEWEAGLERSYMIPFDDEELDGLAETWWLYVLKAVDMIWWIIKIILMWQLMLSFVAIYASLWEIFDILEVCLSRVSHALYLCYLECACHSVLARYKAGAIPSKAGAWVEAGA